MEIKLTAAECDAILEAALPEAKYPELELGDNWRILTNIFFNEGIQRALGDKWKLNMVVSVRALNPN